MYESRLEAEFRVAMVGDWTWLGEALFGRKAINPRSFMHVWLMVNKIILAPRSPRRKRCVGEGAVTIEQEVYGISFQVSSQHGIQRIDMAMLHLSPDTVIVF